MIGTLEVLTNSRTMVRVGREGIEKKRVKREREGGLFRVEEKGGGKKELMERCELMYRLERLRKYKFGRDAASTFIALSL